MINLFMARAAFIMAGALALQGCKSEPSASALQEIAAGFEDVTIQKRTDPVFNRTSYTVRANFLQFDTGCNPIENGSYMCEACHVFASYDVVPHRKKMFRGLNSGASVRTYVLQPADDTSTGWRAQEAMRDSFTPSPEEIGAGSALYDDMVAALAANNTQEVEATFTAFVQGQCATFD